MGQGGGRGGAAKTKNDSQAVVALVRTASTKQRSGRGYPLENRRFKWASFTDNGVAPISKNE
jgi:hypothetical protein